VVNIDLRPCHFGEFSKRIKNVALVGFWQIEKLALKDWIVQI